MNHISFHPLSLPFYSSLSLASLKVSKIHALCKNSKNIVFFFDEIFIISEWSFFFKMLAGLLFIPLSDEARLIHAVRQIPNLFYFHRIKRELLKLICMLTNRALVPPSSPLDRWSTIIVPKASHMTLIVVRKRSLWEFRAMSN